jgi:hypothetical protein
MGLGPIGWAWALTAAKDRVIAPKRAWVGFIDVFSGA